MKEFCYASANQSRSILVFFFKYNLGLSYPMFHYIWGEVFMQIYYTQKNALTILRLE